MVSWKYSSYLQQTHDNICRASAFPYTKKYTWLEFHKSGGQKKKENVRQKSS